MVRVVEMYKSKFQLEEREVFDLLIFDLDGGIRLQTNKKVYLFCTAYFYAALDLSRLLNGEQPKHCDYGSDDVITDPDAVPNKLCVSYDKIMDALDADKVTSNWNGVVPFMTMLRAVHRLRT